MAVRAGGRGAAAAVGLFLLLAGLVGGGVLYLLATQRPQQAVDGFARAPVGCTTTLDFTETGTFYVFEETGSSDAVEVECTQVATPGADLQATFPGDLVPDAVAPDDSITYDIGGFVGRAMQRVEITQPGEYEIVVIGDELSVVAAVGRDPEDGVAGLRQSALIVAIAGTLAGLLLLVVSGRRSKRAAVVAPPDGPGWSAGRAVPDHPTATSPSGSTTTPTGSEAGATTWPPKVPQLDQLPISSPPPAADLSPANVESPMPPPAVSPAVSPAAPPVVGPAPWLPPSGDPAGGLGPPTTPPTESAPSPPPPLPPPATAPEPSTGSTDRDD